MIGKHNGENRDEYFSIIESLLFVSGEALKASQISQAIGCSLKFTKELLRCMMNIYDDASRGIKLIKMEDKYTLVTKAENSEYVEKLIGTNSNQLLSQAALEVLSIIAYKQPITRIDIDEIRGVKSDRAIYNLLGKKLIKESGRLNIPGRPILYSTTDEFLKYFGIDSIGLMPEIDKLTV